MKLLTLDDVDLHGKKVMIREDLNVPIKNGMITSDARLKAALPSIQKLLAANAAVIVLSHLGRPEEGKQDATLSLAPVADALSQLLHKPVRFLKEWLNEINIKPGEIVLCENVRFNVGEKKNDIKLAKQMASLCDIYVMDAFATAHRAEASTCGVLQFAPIACAGPLLMAEINALQKVLANPAHPLIAIVGGAKVSTKIGVLEALMNKVDQLIVGGGIANTFIAASGFAVGKSLYEKDQIETAQRLIKLSKQNGCEIPIPKDVMVAKEFSSDSPAVIKKVNEISADDMILDLGPETIKEYSLLLNKAKTILWNGPIGVFEFAAFENGTKNIARAIAESSAYSVAGGGETLAAIDQYHIANKLSYISTAGGAFLEFIEGKELPAVHALQQRLGQAHG